MADPWEQAAQKYAAKPSGTADAKAPTGSVWDTVNLNPGSPSETVRRFAEGMANAVNPIPGIRAIATDPQGLKHGVEENIFRPQVEQFGKAADAARGKGEFEGMGPIGRASESFGHGLAGALPLVGPSAANAGDQIGSGDVAGGLGSGAGLIAGTMGTPYVTSGIGEGLRHTAEPIFEAATGTRNVDRIGGKRPGRFGLDETKGLSLKKTADTGQQAIEGHAADRAQAMAAAPNARPSLRGAIDVLGEAQKAGAAGNSDMSHLDPMAEQLTIPKPGFAGDVAPINTPPAGTAGPSGPIRISELQNPENFLKMRQRFGKDFTQFEHARPLRNEALATGNKAYRALTDEFHQQVPGTAEPDEAISNLSPVVQGARARALNAGGVQQALHQATAHTGAMALPAAVGLASHNPFSGPIVMGAQGLLRSPTGQLILSRGLNGTGNAVMSPLATRAIQGAQLAKPLRQNDEE